MKPWCAVMCVLMTVVLSIPVKAQGSEEILTRVVWDFQNTEHQDALTSFTAKRTRNMRDWGAQGMPQDEVRVLWKYTGNGFPNGEKVNTIDWKVHFHVLADISEWSPMYFGGPLKIKDREVQRSKSFLADILKKHWDYTSPEDREALYRIVLQQVESEKKLLIEELEEKKPEGYRTGDSGYNFMSHSQVMKVTLTQMIPNEYREGKTIFQTNEKGWELFFIITESMSYWSKEFYGTPFLGEEILLK